MATTVTASNGQAIPDNGPQINFTYNEAGNVSTLTQVYAGITYVQTLSYVDGSVSSISEWVAQ